MSAIRFLRGALLLTACTIPLSGFSQDEVETDADSAALTLGGSRRRHHHSIPSETPSVTVDSSTRRHCAG